MPTSFLESLERDPVDGPTSRRRMAELADRRLTATEARIAEVEARVELLEETVARLDRHNADLRAALAAVAGVLAAQGQDPAQGA